MVKGIKVSGSTIVKINIRELTGREFLAGKSEGMKDFPKFLQSVGEGADGNTVLFDWSEVELATASYFGATLLQLHRLAAAGQIDRYFVNVGSNERCLDDLKLALQVSGLVTLIADIKGNAIHNLTVFGDLDPAYADTFAKVSAQSGVTASDLYQKNLTATGIGKTAWINRLTSLYQQRLIRKEKIGREFRYTTVL